MKVGEVIAYKDYFEIVEKGLGGQVDISIEFLIISPPKHKKQENDRYNRCCTFCLEKF